MAAYGVEVDADEEAYLKLPKNMADFSKLNREKASTDIQMMACKIQMEIKNNEHEDDTNVNGENVENVEAPPMMNGKVFDSENLKVSFAEVRATDMKNCSRVTVPDAVKTRGLETKIQTLIGNIEEAVELEDKKTGKLNQSCLTDGASDSGSRMVN